MASSKNRAGSGSNLKPFYLLLGIVVLVGVGLMIFGARRRGATRATMEPVNLEAMGAGELIAKAKGVRLGPDSAKVQIMVFSDYMCPGCAAFATNIEPQLLQEYVQTGLVQYTMYDFPLGGTHKYSFLAARAGRCAEDQGKYWEYHKYLMVNQTAWSYSQAPPVEQFVSYAGQLGLNQQDFEACLDSDKHAELVTANHQLGQQAGVNSTPTVFIDGRQSLGSLDWEVLRSEINRALGR